MKISIVDTKLHHLTHKERFLICEAYKQPSATYRSRFKGVALSPAGDFWIAAIYSYEKQTAGRKPEWHKREVKIKIIP